MFHKCFWSIRSEKLPPTLYWLIHCGYRSNQFIFLPALRDSRGSCHLFDTLVTGMDLPGILFHVYMDISNFISFHIIIMYWRWLGIGCFQIWISLKHIATLSASQFSSFSLIGFLPHLYPWNGGRTSFGEKRVWAKFSYFIQVSGD